MSSEISVQNEQFELIQRQAKMFLASGFFKTVKDMAQACVKMEIARAMGLSPVQGLMGIHFVNERLTLEATLMAAVAKRGGYEFRAIAHNDKIAHIAILSARGEKLGESSFSIEDAARAQLLSKDNWKKYPKNMVWARAMANACRWYCSDAFGGTTPYIPEELGADVDDQGRPVVEMNYKVVTGAPGAAVEFSAHQPPLEALNAALTSPRPKSNGGSKPVPPPLVDELVDSESDMIFEME
jgi:hypothetical protein